MLKSLDKEILSPLQSLLCSDEEQYNIELNEAEVEYEKGEFISQEDLQKRITKW